MLGEKIRRLRLAKGLSQDALVEKAGSIFTKAALSKYEIGRMNPSPKLLNAIANALEVKAITLLTEPTVNIGFVAFRSLKSATKCQKEQVKAHCIESFENILRLQEFDPNPFEFKIELQSKQINRLEEIEEKAMEVREEWDLGLDPIANVRETLEDKNIYTIGFATKEKIDGCSLIASNNEGEKIAAAILAKTDEDVSGERQRLTCAHELGHLYLGIPDEINEEDAAYRFAGAFLAPKEIIFSSIGQKRDNIDINELFILKARYGISVAALILRLRDLKIISDTFYTALCRYRRARGWSKIEPGDSHREESSKPKQMAIRAVAEGLITKRDAEALVGEKLNIEDTPSRIREIMKLSLDERRKLMQKSAEKLAELYENDKEWKDFQGGDFDDD